MPFSAYVFYLESKYKHEVIRDIYISDMLRFAAFGMVEERDRPPRYWDVLRSFKPDGSFDGRGSAADVGDYDEQDVIDMFRGNGKLEKGSAQK